MANMARKIGPGDYQIGIWNVRRMANRQWKATATGPGTIGDGHGGWFLSLDDAHLHLTGEERREVQPIDYSRDYSLTRPTY